MNFDWKYLSGGPDGIDCRQVYCDFGFCAGPQWPRLFTSAVSYSSVVETGERLRKPFPVSAKIEAVTPTEWKLGISQEEWPSSGPPHPHPVQNWDTWRSIPNTLKMETFLRGSFLSACLKATVCRYITSKLLLAEKPIHRSKVGAQPKQELPKNPSVTLALQKACMRSTFPVCFSIQVLCSKGFL